MNPLPLVKMSDLQKKTKKVVEEVKENGYRFVMNRGNVEVVMISLPLYTEKFSDKGKKGGGKSGAFADWKGKSWRKILKELREEDNKKPTDVYLKELMVWQKQLLS